MDQESVVNYITTAFPDVETTTAMTYIFFFYGAERMLPFATLAFADNDYDRSSNLDRPGVYRLNVGVSHETFQSLFGPERADPSRYDYAALDRIMPHPDYAPQNWICVLSPSDATFEQVVPYLAEAHELARARAARRATQG